MKFFKKNSNEVNVEGTEVNKEEKMNKEIDSKFVVKVIGTVVIGALAIGTAAYKFINRNSVDSGYSDLPATDDFNEVSTPVANETDFAE